MGLVTEGVMEIYENIETLVQDTNNNRKPERRLPDKKRQRKKTTAVLYPGMFFGLFEAYSNLPPGNWTITSGSTSFMVCNPIGNSRFWVQAQRKDMIVEDIQVTTRSNLACAEHLLREDTYSNWKSESVWLKPGMIDDTNLRMAVENLGSSPRLRSSAKARHTRRGYAFAYCVHFATRTPSSGSA